MNGTDKILSIARKELGITECPAGSNQTKYGKWYGLDGNPWCMMFVMWVFQQAGILKEALIKAGKSQANRRR